MNKSVDEILNGLTLEEKVALCSGANFWQTKSIDKERIPALFMCDGPHGLRKQELKKDSNNGGADMLGINKSVKATCFPTASISACSWDRELLAEMGRAIAEEAKHYHVGLVLGPGLCIKRNPLCGRNFEYFSEDPYLSGRLAASFVKASELEGVGTSLKHFACNNQERRRFVSASRLDERTLREIYLSGFEYAVKEGHPSTVMAAYNKIDEEYCSSNHRLLTNILREEWGFDGLVVTDWGAMHDREKSLEAGCDLAMPGGSGYGEQQVIEAVKTGALSEEVVNRCVRRIITLLIKEIHVKKDTPVDFDTHNALAIRLATESAVLLKNEEQILPLGKKEKISIIGAMAESPRYQGAGSSHINPWKLTSLLDVMGTVPYAKGYRSDGSTTEELLQEARGIANNSEKVVLCVGLPDSYEAEGFDRRDMKMPEGHLRLIQEVSKANQNVIVVLMCGAAVETPWVDSIKALLYVGLTGQGNGEVIRQLLYGEVNPSGRLAETWPLRYEDCPSASFYGEGYDHGEYREGIFVGYRYYDRAKVPVRFPFGYGLSYTEFEYSGLKIEDQKVQIMITNRGKIPGAEVVQLYISPMKTEIARPYKELKGFEKIFLQPGESKEVCFRLDERSFAIWQDGWKIPAGSYEIKIGDQYAEMKRTGEEVRVPEWQKGHFYESVMQSKGVSIAATVSDFTRMMGTNFPERVLKKGNFTMDNTVLEMKPYSLLAKIMYYVTKSIIKKGLGPDVDDSSAEYNMMLISSTDIPLNSSVQSAGMDPKIFEGLLEMMNGHLIRGIRKMIR